MKTKVVLTSILFALIVPFAARAQESDTSSVEQRATELREAALAEGMRSKTPLTEIPFDASGKNPGNGQPVQFKLFVDAKALTWIAGKNGDVHVELELATAGVSAKGSLLANQVKTFEASRTKEEAAKTPQSAVILGATFSVPSDAVTVRFVLRDARSRHLGSFELPVSRIKTASPATAPTGGAPAQH